MANSTELSTIQARRRTRAHGGVESSGHSRRNGGRGRGYRGLCAIDQPPSAQPTVEQFYKGRTITLHVPTSPGGINDIAGGWWHGIWVTFIPGNPGFVVQNSPGGNGLVAANKLFNTAARDGSVISIMGRATPQAAIQGDPQRKIRPARN